MTRYVFVGGPVRSGGAPRSGGTTPPTGSPPPVPRCGRGAAGTGRWPVPGPYCPAPPAGPAAPAGRSAGAPAALRRPWLSVTSSSTAVTSRRARSCWAATANGTRNGRPVPRMPDTSSTSRQAASCAQANHATQASTLSTNWPGWAVSRAAPDRSGSGLPITSSSTAGVPTTISSISSAATTPRRASARRGSRPAPGSGGSVAACLLRPCVRALRSLIAPVPVSAPARAGSAPPPPALSPESQHPFATVHPPCYRPV
jgi:hypothetical protein